jgi:DNA-binding NarL/FixJ family response regulator
LPWNGSCNSILDDRCRELQIRVHSTTRILLADAQRLTRAGYAALIESVPGFEVVAEADDGCRAIDLCVEAEPDLAVLDVQLPAMNGIDAVAELRRRRPETRALMLAAQRSAGTVLAALDAGADGYLLRTAPPADLHAALAAVRDGNTWLSPEVASLVVEARRNGADAGAGPLPMLTARQRQVLQLIAEGWRAAEIAERLRISTKTVESHRRNLMLRLDQRDVPGLVRLAIRSGLLRLHD